MPTKAAKQAKTNTMHVEDNDVDRMLRERNNVQTERGRQVKKEPRREERGKQ